MNTFFMEKIALVTGGGSGIGRAICRILARDGARVVAGDINLESAQQTIKQVNNPPKHLAVELNVTDKGSVLCAFDSIKNHFNATPQLLAQAAGITRDNFLLKLDEKQFMDTINVNLKGTFLVQQELVKRLEVQNLEGSVVNFGSIVAKNGNMGQCNYAASKAGVIAFSKSTAKELAKQNVRVNCVLPGFVETPMVETVPDKLKAMVLFATPMNRFGKPEEIAEVVSFLLSDKSSFMTGSVVEVTGGLA